MVQLNMTLARHNELKARFNGKSKGIHNDLKIAGFDIKRDWSVGQDKETGNFIFMQADPIPEEKNPVKVSMSKTKKKAGISSKKDKK